MSRRPRARNSRSPRRVRTRRGSVAEAITANGRHTGRLFAMVITAALLFVAFMLWLAWE